MDSTRWVGRSAPWWRTALTSGCCCPSTGGGGGGCPRRGRCMRGGGVGAPHRGGGRLEPRAAAVLPRRGPGMNAEPAPAAQTPVLHLRLDGFEGPLDLLLELARSQKVDLERISILSLVDQFIAVVEQARRVRLEIAADWLVMAAWLAWLKSRLLLPPEEAEPEEDAEAPAAGLAGRPRGARARGGGA